MIKHFRHLSLVPETRVLILLLLVGILLAEFEGHYQISWKKSFDKPRQSIKKQRHHFADKGLYNQSYDFSSSHVWMWELGHIEGWVLKNRCFQIVVLEKTLENSLDCKEIKPDNPKGNQPWIFIGRTETEALAARCEDTLATRCEELTH